MTSPAPLTDAEALERITANLDAYIDARAAELAALQIAEVRAELEQSRKETAAAEQRWTDLKAEVHRQLAALERQVAEAHMLAAHLPEHVRIAGGLRKLYRQELVRPALRSAVERAQSLSLPASKETQQ